MTRKGVCALVFATMLMGGVKPTLAEPGDGHESSEASIHIINGYQLVVEGRIGSLGGLRFLIDTGQTFSCIDRQVAKKLQLALQSARVFNMDKTLRIESAEIHDLSYAGQSVPSLRVLVGDLRYSRANAAAIDGVIGLDLLARNSFVLDLAGKRITFGASALRAWKSVRMVSDGTCLRVALEVDGRSVWMIADTAMRGIVFYREELDSINANYTTGRQINGVSVGGSIPFLPALVPRLRLGGQDLDREAYLLTSGTMPRQENAGGYIGLSTLHARWIEFDFAEQVLRWAN